MFKYLESSPKGCILIPISTLKTQVRTFTSMFCDNFRKGCRMTTCDNCSYLGDEVERLTGLVEKLECDYEVNEIPKDLFDFIERYPGIAEDFLEFVTQEYKVEDRNSAEAVTWLRENHRTAYYYYSKSR